MATHKRLKRLLNKAEKIVKNNEQIEIIIEGTQKSDEENNNIYDTDSAKNRVIFNINIGEWEGD